VVLRRFGWVALLAVGWPGMALAGKPMPCVTAEEATKLIDKDVCVSAHIYDVVELPDGTRFLDVCAPETPDAQCRFTLVHGRAGIVVSHARQFYGGPPKFRPNPRLARGFNGEAERPPLYDPNLRSQGGHRAFMNTRDRETLPGK